MLQMGINRLLLFLTISISSIAKSGAAMAALSGIRLGPDVTGDRFMFRLKIGDPVPYPPENVMKRAPAEDKNNP